MIYISDMSIEALSLDQIRIFLTVAETGTFSAAAKKLGRVQSAVSYAIANMEDQLQVQLFDRSSRRPELTDAGHQILIDARAVDERVAALKSRARSMSLGLEPKLSIAVEVLYPMKVIAEVLAKLAVEYPTLPVELHVETLGGTPELLRNGTCDVAILGPLFTEQRNFPLVPLCPIRSIPVCAPHYTLAGLEHPLTRDDLVTANQLVLTDRSQTTKGKDFSVFSSNSWRLTDMGAKHELLRAGLGWGFMPFHLVSEDLQAGALVQIQIADMGEGHQRMSFSAATNAEAPPGPGGRRFIELLADQKLL